MIKTTTCYTADCDVCDYTFEEDGDGIVHFATTERALESARDAGWWATATDILCDGGGFEHSAKAAEIADRIAQGNADGKSITEFLAWCGKAGYEIYFEPPSFAAKPGQTAIQEA